MEYENNVIPFSELQKRISEQRDSTFVAQVANNSIIGINYVSKASSGLILVAKGRAGEIAQGLAKLIDDQ